MLSIVVLILAAPLIAAAQGNTVRPRITDRVDNSRLTTLRGNTHPLARPQFDQGAAPPNLPMNRILLMLQRSPEQEAALQDLLVQQQTTGSPTFHKWLTPDEFGRQFGPADADIQQVTSWLASFGFQSIKVSRGHTVVEFSGTAAQVEAALHTPIHRYVVNGKSHWANANDPQIPAALAPVISGVVSLHNFARKPASVRSGHTATLTRTPEGKPLINFTGGSHGIAPADFAKIYNIPSTATGSGITIGVVARSNINTQDVANFRSIFGLTGGNFSVVLDGPDPGNLGAGEEAEAVLDATWPGAVAPSATVDLVVSETTNAASGEDLSEFYIIDNNLADVMTESFSGCEAGVSSSLANAYMFMAEQAAAQGITYLVASGDGGPDSCDDQTTIPATDAPASVNVLASTPFTIAVGGTEFHDCDPLPTCNDTSGKYWQSTNGTNSESAIGYIPENVWNESCTVAQCGAASAGLWSSGGGQSMFFPIPFWQVGVTGIPSSGGRAVPDVAVSAADHDGYVLCISSSGNCQSTNTNFTIISGTSASVQAFGGIMALVDQAKGRQGQADVVLYKLAAGQPPTSPGNSSCDGSNTTTLPATTCIFHDVTSGNTNIPGENGFPAKTGYDETTGLGSVNVTNLLAQWSSAITKASTTTLVLNSNNPVTITHGQSVPVSITVAPASPTNVTPTGDVSLIAASSTGQGADGFTLTASGLNGVATGTTTLLPGSPTPGASYNVTAHYAGDANFLGSDSPPVSVIVNPESSLTSLALVTPTSTNATSVVYGSAYVLTVQVTNSAGTLCNTNGVGGPACPTGTVALTDNGAPLDGGSFKLNSLGEFEDQPIQLPVGTHGIKAVYAGDNSFNGSASTTDTVMVTKASTTTTVAANPASVASGASSTLTATVSTQSNAVASASQEPTGNVQFLLNGSPFGSPVAVTGGASSTGLAQATASTGSGVLANGSYTFAAQYLGDSNYSASTISPGVTVSVGTPGINISPASNTATITISAPGQSGTQAITVSAANGFIGSVALTCAVTTTMTGVYGMPTCSFTPSSTIALTSTTTSGQQTLNVNTIAASSVFKPSGRHRGPGPSPLTFAEVVTALAGMLLLALTVKRRRGVMLLALAIVAVVAIGSSCGSNYNNGGSHPGTTTGTYTVTVTATPQSGSGASAQSTMIAVNVQ